MLVDTRCVNTILEQSLDRVENQLTACCSRGQHKVKVECAALSRKWSRRKRQSNSVSLLLVHSSGQQISTEIQSARWSRYHECPLSWIQLEI